MFKAKFSELLNCQSGNTALIFGVAFSVIVTVVGVAIDIQQIQTQKSKAQDALDAAALFYADENTQKDIGQNKRNISNYLASNYNDDLKSKLTNIGADVTDEGHLRVTANMKMKPLVGGIIGYEQYKADIETVVALPPAEIRRAKIGIVWDASTSMTFLLPEVKSAALSLYNELTDLGVMGEFSIFPYSQFGSNRNYDLLLSKKVIERDSWEINNYIENLEIMTHVSESTISKGAACGWEALRQANRAIERVDNGTANVIFLMHDGDGWCPDDDKILEQCQIIRDRGIHLVTIRFGSYDSREQLFLDCSGNPDNYFYVHSAETAFEALFEGINSGNYFEKYIVK